jgi:hypothetical protein
MNNTGGPAFPHVADLVQHSPNGGITTKPITSNGMALRDYFAAKAMPFTYQFWMTDYYHPDAVDAEIRAEESREGLTTVVDLIAETAYAMADAMLKAREA